MELNKIAGAILLAGLIGLIVGKVSTALYGGGGVAHHGGEHEVARGYQIEVTEDAGHGGAQAAAKQELASIIPLLASADAAAGEAYFAKKCATCHTADKGGKSKTGPNLWNVVDRAKGGVDGFSYSKAMVAKGGDWTYDDLNGFLHKPKKWMKGTMMAFAGIKKDQDRADLVAYLRSQSDSPAAIPAAPVEAVDVEAPAAEAGE